MLILFNKLYKVQYNKIENKGIENRFFPKIHSRFTPKMLTLKIENKEIEKRFFPKIHSKFTLKMLTPKIHTQFYLIVFFLLKSSTNSNTPIGGSSCLYISKFWMIKCGYLHDILASLQSQPLDEN